MSTKTWACNAFVCPQAVPLPLFHIFICERGGRQNHAGKATAMRATSPQRALVPEVRTSNLRALFDPIIPVSCFLNGMRRTSNGSLLPAAVVLRHPSAG